MKKPTVSYSYLSWCLVAGMALLPSVIHAQIATDGTVGAAQTLTGPNFTIPQTLGTTAGSNLFHSFSTFNINAGQSANFTTTTALDNVISRVTGGSVSTINGQLQLTAALGAPDFWFINPAGVVFGAGASINVPGAFHLGTADYIAFPDGDFKATVPAGSTLSSAAPEAFGFLGTQSNDIVINNGATLSLSNGSTLALAGGDITVNNAVVRNLNGGDIEVTAVGNTVAEIPVGGTLPATTGNLQLLNGGRIYTETSGALDAGDVTVMAGDITINDQNDTANGTYIGTSNTSASTGGSGGAISVTATGDLRILDGGQITANTYASGDSGTVNIKADELFIDNVDNSAWYTGVLVTSDASASGDAQDISIDVNGKVSVVNGSEISINTYGSGNAGWLTLSADELLVDGQGNSFFTGLASNVQSGATGSASGVDLDIDNAITVTDGGTIQSNTWGAGNAGSVLVEGGSLSIDRNGSSLVTGILSNAESGSTGDAGLVSIDISGDIDISNRGEIGSNTFASGDAGTVLVEGDNITLDGQGGASGFTGIASNADSGSSGDGGLVSVTANGNLKILDGSEISSNTFGAGDAGKVVVEAEDILIDRDGSIAFTGIASEAAATSLGDGGIVSVTANNSLTLEEGGQIASNTYGVGDAGYVVVDTVDMSIDGQGSGYFTGLASTAEIGSSGNAGAVVVTASGDITVQDGGGIASDTWENGDAGTVSVDAGTISIDGMGSSLFTGIGTNAKSGSSGDAGYVIVKAKDAITLDDGAQIVSNSNGAGDAGYVEVTAKSLTADGGGSTQLTGVATIADTSSTGNAGYVEVNVNDIRLTEGAVIASDTRSSGDAGYVDVTANNVYIEGVNVNGDAGGITSSTRGSGTAGGVSLTVRQQLSILEGGIVSSDNWSTGNAGSVVVDAGNILIDDRNNTSYWTGISSDTVGASGDAGLVSVTASGGITLVNDGAISSDTYGAGVAGDVSVTGDVINLRSGSEISAQARSGSSGQTGNVVVTANNNLSMSSDASISIENKAIVATPSLLTPTSLTVTAPTISMNNANITANATGNVDASNINVRFNNALTMDAVSGITTVSTDGNGGAISIAGGDLLRMNDSQISTSVTGLQGNGGNINLQADKLILNTGFIQANTAADNATGGDVSIRINTLIASLNTVYIGGRSAYTFQPGIPGFNVIQAAAPTGLSGAVVISTPLVDLSASLRGLNAGLVDTGGLGRSPCSVGSGSSLAAAGHGGLPVSASGLARGGISAVSGDSATVLTPSATQLASISGLPARMVECVPL